VRLSIYSLVCRHPSPKNSHNLFWHTHDWKVIDLSERLQINPSKLTTVLNIFACLFFISVLFVPLTNASSTTDRDYQAIENDSYTIGVQAYIYGLAPVTIQRTEKIFVATPGMGHAPVNKMGYLTHLATANDTDVVAPNADTLYNIAWLELEKEPIVLHAPDTNTLLCPADA
jgi:Protein of unknown function (DUF1254)